MYLENMRDELQQIADAIMSVVGLDVTIIDEKQTRIAGTGKYRSVIGSAVPQNSVFEQCINTGLQYVVKEPRKCNVCQTCNGQNSCTEEAEICYPIKTSKGVVGIIGMIAFTPEQKLAFLKKEKHYMHFVSRMSKLISSRLREKVLHEELCYQSVQLRTIMDTVDEGIIGLDHNGIILSVNKWVREKFGIKEEEAVGKNIDELLPNNRITPAMQAQRQLADYEETLYINGVKDRFLLSVKPFSSNAGKIGAVVTLKDFDKLRRSIHQISESSAILDFDKIKGISPNFLRVKEQAKQVALQEVTVLLLGESGTGKELFARAIHYESRRKNEVFLPINCGAIPDSLLESELFGYEKGAFTGANPRGKMGKFEMANRGTLFLDEIGDLPMHMQVKLLRVLQEKEIVRVGGTTPFKVDVRIIAATNKNLWEKTKKGEFREDLFYRLNVIPINIPPLRERSEDIGHLADWLLKRYTKIYGKQLTGITEEAKELLSNYTWPGNVRELENCIEFGVIFEKGSLLTSETIAKKIHVEDRSPVGNGGLKQMLAHYEQSIIENLLNHYGRDTEAKHKIANHLKISTATLYRKLQDNDSQKCENVIQNEKR